MTLASLFSALLSLCSWICIPVSDIGITLQTFGISLALLLLGGKWGTVSIGIYLLLGAAGLPVFSGFRGGIGALMHVTGGFLWGFLVAGGLYWLLEKRLPLWLNLLIVTAVCYLCGGVWYAVAFGGDFWTVLMVCVVPYLLPDGCKYALAVFLAPRLKKYV
jgi:biotin transport system substrate-specific component